MADDHEDFGLLPVQFYKLSDQRKQDYLVRLGLCTYADLKLLRKRTSLDHELASSFIENAIGCFPMPLGLAFHFVIDEQSYVIPMVTEETSVIAAASKTAKWITQEGKLSTEQVGTNAIGQIQIARVKDFTSLEKKLIEQKDILINGVNTSVLCTLTARGGGLKDITIRRIERGDGDSMAILHLYIDCMDAMGANIINQACEYLKADIEQLTGETVNMCILSNLTDTRITRAKVVFPHINRELGEKIVEASLFAQLDPYRAATNNKGVMNGIDSVLIATGNDWRAVGAGIHAYASRSGQYSSITRWTLENDSLCGVLEAPIQVGIVGGVTRLHPIAQICLKIMKIQSAATLARIVAAVGIVQNLGALRALVSEGIIRGHMSLHLTNLAISVGAKKEELVLVEEFLKNRLTINKRITESDAREAVQSIRSKKQGLDYDK